MVSDFGQATILFQCLGLFELIIGLYVLYSFFSTLFASRR
jgi:hypothetical protein